MVPFSYYTTYITCTIGHYISSLSRHKQYFSFTLALTKAISKRYTKVSFITFSTPNKSIDLLFMRRGGKIIKENIQQMTHQQQQYSSSEMIDYKYEHKISS